LNQIRQYFVKFLQIYLAAFLLSQTLGWSISTMLTIIYLLMTNTAIETLSLMVSSFKNKLKNNNDLFAVFFQSAILNKCR